MNPHQNELQKTLHSGKIGQGKKVEQFEELLSKLFNRTALATNSGTSALQIALSCFPGRQFVFLSGFGCFATIAAVINSGKVPVWVDIDQDLNLDPKDLEQKISGREQNSIVLPVHLCGRVCRVPSLDKVIVIEDCAQAFGARFQFDPHRFYCFSFQAVKTLTTGDGGCILPALGYENLVKKLRWFGLDRKLTRSQDVAMIGGKYHMNNLNASIGIANLNLALYSVFQQVNNARLIQQVCDRVGLPWSENGSYPTFPLLVSDPARAKDIFASHGVEATTFLSRIDTKSVLKQFLTRLPTTEYVANRFLEVPCGWWCGQSDINNIRQAIIKLEKFH